MKNLLAQTTESWFEGIVAIDEMANGWLPRRMTEAQLAVYDEAPGWALRARCTAGIVIAFRSDSPTLDIDADVEEGCRGHFGLDVEVDGVLRRSVRHGELANIPCRERLLDLSDEPRREWAFRIYLPHDRRLVVRAIGLADDASIAALPRRPGRLLALGDSITQGMAAISPYTTYPVQLARLLDLELLNQGVGGHIFDAASLDPALPCQPDLITVAYGTNDWSRGLTAEQIADTAGRYLAKVRETWPEAPVAVLTPLWRKIGHETKPGGTLPAFGEVIAATAAGLGCHVVDGRGLVPNDLWFMPDGTHPSETGFLHYAINLCRAVRPLLTPARP